MKVKEKRGYGYDDCFKRYGEKRQKRYDESSYKKEDIDVSEHVDALVSGENDLSEEFKTKSATIFESAIKAKVKEIVKQWKQITTTN